MPMFTVLLESLTGGPLTEPAALMLPRVTLIFIQCRKVRSLAKKALASVRRRVAIFF